MLDSWKSGQYSTPFEICKKVEKIYKVKIPTDAKIKPLYWHTKDSGKKGGQVSQLLYGNPGTKEGRAKGGTNSLKSQKLRGTAFKFLKIIKAPCHSKNLSELVGILIGDGNISRYQTRVSLDIIKDIEYADFVKNLFETLFKTRASLFRNEKKSTIDVIVSSKSLTEFLINLGLPQGNKIKQQIDIPDWIKKDNSYKKACLRGIFDTDGSVYLDKHFYKGKEYKSMNIDFTSASKPLLRSIRKVLVDIGFTPTSSYYKSVKLRRKNEVISFFDVIGSSNIKHIRRYKKYQNYGGVPKRP